MECQIVPKSEIVSLVMAAIENAQTEILATMLLSEELADPLPVSYYNLLERKLLVGVEIKRLAFGNVEEFEAFQDRYPFKHANYKCSLISDGVYRRMIMIDQKRFFFAIDSDRGRVFYSAIDLAHIREFYDYFSFAS